MYRFFFALVCITFLPAGILFSWSSFEPESWEYWENHEATSQEIIDHSEWDDLLGQYVVPDGQGLNRFAYSAFTEMDKERLDAYVKSLEAVEITLFNRSEQLAYWLNLYNALTIQVVLDHYPVKSIKEIDLAGLLSKGPWKAELIFVEEVEMSLDAVEHEILRPIWRDPRVHYGLNCASIGCPNLHTNAFSGATVDSTLDTLAAAFINHPRGVTIEDGELIVSSIYSWFAFDFGNSQAGIIEHVSKFADPDLKAQIAEINRISDHRYNWSLNE